MISGRKEGEESSTLYLFLVRNKGRREGESKSLSLREKRAPSAVLHAPRRGGKGRIGLLFSPGRGVRKASFRTSSFRTRSLQGNGGKRGGRGKGNSPSCFDRVVEGGGRDAGGLLL